MSSASAVQVDVPYTGPSWKCRYEYAGSDALQPPVGNVMHPPMGNEYVPAGAGHIEFMDRSEEIIWRAIGKAEEPARLLVPEVGSTGPHLLPPRISADGSLVCQVDMAGRSALRQTEIADGRNGAAELPFDQANAAAAPELRLVHMAGSVGWPGGSPYGAAWGTALHRRVVPSGMGGTGRQIQTSYGDIYNYNPPSPGSPYFQPTYPALNSLQQGGGGGLSAVEIQPNLVAYTYDSNGNCSAVNFPNIGNNGGWINFYNGAGNLDHVKNMETNLICTLRYDGANHLDQITLPGGQITSIVCDPGSGVVSRIYQPGQPPITINYDGPGHITGWVAPNGEITTIGYDGAGRVQAVQCPDGRITTYSWDPGGTPGVVVRNPAGAIHTLVFNASRQLQSWTDAYGNVHTYTWFNDRLQDVTDPVGNVTTMIHVVCVDQSRRLQTFATQPGTTPVTFMFGYDNNSYPRLVTVTDELNNLSTLTYSGGVQRNQLINPLGKIWTYSYSATRITQVQTPTGEAWNLNYDGNNQRLSQQDPLGALITNTYNGAGRLTNVATPYPGATVHRDQYQRMQGVGNALNQFYTLTFDPAARVASLLDPTGGIVTSTYWMGMHLHSVADPLNRVTSYAYDLAGNDNVRRDPVGNVYTTLFDLNNRPHTQIDPLNGVVLTNYDAANRPVSIVDQMGAVSTRVFDGAGRRIASTDPLNRTSTTVFDAAGRVIAKRNPLNEISTITYNAGGLATQSKDPLGLVTTRSFDAAGRVATVMDARQNISTQLYDPCGRATTFTNALGNSRATQYDAAGRAVTHIAVPLPEMSAALVP